MSERESVTSLAERVAAQYRFAGFIPDKFFKNYTAELKKLFATSLRGKPLEETPWLIENDVIPLFKRFTKELIELAPKAQETLQGRLDTRVTMLEKLAASYKAARKALDAPFPAVTPLDHVRFHIQVTAGGSLEKLLPTLGKAFKVELIVDADKVEALARKGLRQATPEELAAIAADQDWSNQTLTIKYGFYEKHIDKSIPRLIKKQKVDQTFLVWFDFVRQMLEANYAGEPRYSQFELNGMKVVIDDNTVTPKQNDEYVKYLDEAYNRLKAKKLARAWYGTVYIECEGCGGVNQNTGGGVGGHFNIGRDHVKIFSRPSKFIVELMAHELGHRYWFKSMSVSQRAKFESLVRAYKSKRPEGIIPNLIPPKSVEKAKARMLVYEDREEKALEAFREEKGFFRTVVDDWETTVTSTAHSVLDIPMAAVDVIVAFDAETKSLYKDMIDARNEVVEFLKSRNYRALLDDAINALPDGTDTARAFSIARGNFVDHAKRLVTTVTLTAMIYVDRAVQLHNEVEQGKIKVKEEARQKEWDADSREILPVSAYGKSNIDEAFAEVFAYYCLDRKLTADQEASFRAVLLDKDRTASKVASRWLRGDHGGSSGNCQSIGS